MALGENAKNDTAFKTAEQNKLRDAITDALNNSLTDLTPTQLANETGYDFAVVHEELAYMIEDGVLDVEFLGGIEEPFYSLS